MTSCLLFLSPQKLLRKLNETDNHQRTRGYRMPDHLYPIAVAGTVAVTSWILHPFYDWRYRNYFPLFRSITGEPVEESRRLFWDVYPLRKGSICLKASSWEFDTRTTGIAEKPPSIPHPRPSFLRTREIIECSRSFSSMRTVPTQILCNA